MPWRVLIAATLLASALSLHLEDVPYAGEPGGVATFDTSADCVWPACMPRCIPCAAREVGTCKLGLMTSFFGCSSSRGPTDCILGKCLCARHYCATEDGEKCEPQVCLPGATPPPFAPIWWNNMFYAMAGIPHFPGPVDLQEHMMDYAWILARPALALAEIGLFVATCVVVCLCCCRGVGIMHLSIGGQGKPVPLRQRPVDGGSDPEDEARGLAPAKPWACPLLCLVLFILCFNWLCIKIRHRSFSRDVGIMGTQFIRAYDDIKTVAEQAAIINNTCLQFKSDVFQVPLSCKVDDPITQFAIKKGVNMADDSMAEYVHQVQHLYNSVRKLPYIMEAIATLFVDNMQLIIWVPLIPTLLISLICLLILVEAIAARCFSSSMLADCIDCGLRTGSVLFFAIIIVVSLIAAAELAVCVTASLFCMDVDENSLAYIQMAVGGNATDPYSDAYNASRYYIRGDMYNPIVGYAEAAEKYITQVVDIYQDVERELKMVGKVCPGINEIDVEHIGTEAFAVLGKVREILNGTNVYEYYYQIVRQGACKGVVRSLGWITLFQVLMGLVLFPMCILLAHFFLVRFATWKHFMDDDRGSSDSEDEDSEEEDSPNGYEDSLKQKAFQLEQGDGPAVSGTGKVAPADVPYGGKQSQDQDYSRYQNWSRTDDRYG